MDGCVFGFVTNVVLWIPHCAGSDIDPWVPHNLRMDTASVFTIMGSGIQKRMLKRPASKNGCLKGWYPKNVGQ